MRKDFRQIEWDERLIHDCLQLIRSSIAEDLDRGWDLTSIALIDSNQEAQAALVAREPGVICGLKACELILQEADVVHSFQQHAQDGELVSAGTPVARICASARDLLATERLLLNFTGRMSGVASATRRCVDKIVGTQAKIYDTRKTLPGWRRLDKYAVRCGGGTNHRTGLFDAILVKDNHLAQINKYAEPAETNLTNVVHKVRSFLKHQATQLDLDPDTIVEVEVDSLIQLKEILPTGPDIVLLDNMSPSDLRAAVRWRDLLAPDVQLEASGRVNHDTLRTVAETGVDRISSGALTHSSPSLDIGLDWC